MFDDIIALISHDNYYRETEEENISNYVVEYSFPSLDKFNGHLDELISLIDERDFFVISLTMDHLSPIEFTNINDIDSFVQKVKEEFLEIFDEESEFILTIRIKKNVSANKLSFYSEDLFNKLILGKNFEEQLAFFNELIHNYKFIHFIIMNNNSSNMIYTHSFSISYNTDSTPVLKQPQHRENILNKSQNINNIINNKSADKLVPEDFIIIKKIGSFGKIEKCISKLCFGLSVAFVFDIVEIENNKLWYKLNGYKPIVGEVQLDNTLIYNSEEITSIYKWVYTGNINDKVGIARNIISLNINKVERNGTSDFYLTPNTFPSIKSGFEIYLKENVGRYIDIKNKVSEFMINKSLESSDIIRGFMNSLKNNNYLFVTFFMTFIVFKALNPEESYIFTKEIIYISFAVLLISLVYLFFNIVFVNMEKQRFIDQYNKLKRMYTDLLSNEDISSIFLEEEHEEDVSYIKQKQRLFIRIWLIEIVVLLILVLVLGRLNSVL